MIKKFRHWLVLLSFAFLVTGCSQPPTEIHMTGQTMGTYYSIKVVSQDGMPDKATLQAALDDELEAVNGKMSTYKPDSELSQFNQSRQTTPIMASAEMTKVVKEAIRISKATDGALDVTVGPLVNLWGFGPDGRPDRVPSEQDIAERLSHVGIQNLSVTDNTMTKQIPELYVDLSSIAKGFGVDQAADYLDRIGMKNYLVEVGGELRVRGHNSKNVPWRVAIERPAPGETAVQGIIAPGDMAIATSGDYRNFFDQDGVRYSHTINPKTGRPITSQLVSVTVVAKSCMTADAFATGLDVLGPEKGLEVAEKENLAVFLIVQTKDGFEEYASTAFKPYMKSWSKTK
ncbi:FAD:protein FMN transferase [Vibrio sp. SS-MA-C1-2]|uniref:FAD:protein FMN transferase n=1 Tax=Vibrio sp. SS-MA-C1-2 TaxID=2908646 RepID=UPI001F29A7D1|nr:FAD:protein FMN transferase [Vibrio sp. SS-MA-C1-2]UJF18834.1 FAD:protein FMN transferase [Vibrio sp. SS-MA-C1-2]